MKNESDYSMYKCPYEHIEKDCGHELKGPEGYENAYGVWCACGFRGPVFCPDPKDLKLERKINKKLDDKKAYKDKDHKFNSPKYHTGKKCVEGCGNPAGTFWSPHWCFECNVKRIDRISKSLNEMTAKGA